MTKYLTGFVGGWLFTNLFSIPLPPIWFWWLLIAIFILLIIVGRMAYILNKEGYPDDEDTDTYDGNIH